MTALAFLSITTLPSASAQDAGAPPLPYRETVVVTGAAAPTTVADLSRTVRIITREEIDALPAQSVDNLLRLIASVDVRSRGQGVQSDFAVRGAGFGQTLVLLDGHRVNNAQSGHHNADLPVTLDQIERIEVLLGPGSSLYGADAFGGTINVITRSRAPRAARFAGGADGFVEARAAAGWGERVRPQVAFGLDRSSGFTFDRDYRTMTVSTRLDIGDRTTFSAGHVDKDFGAAGFYGNSPSKEWTNATVVGLRQTLRRGAKLDLTATGGFRAHRDHFRWDVARPGFAENRHRTYAWDGGLGASWKLSDTTDLQFGGEAAADRIESSNLGDHSQDRGAVFAEARQKVGTTATLTASLRFDHYSTFGSAWSPGAGASWWLSSSVRIRGSAGHAFRVPTFTERFYFDPAHRATADLDAEEAWSVDAAVDWIPNARWILTAGGFDRHERNVIDWVKERPAHLWQTTNIHRVRASGLELGVRRAAGSVRGAIDYTWLATDPDDLTLLSKYTSDYARHSLVGSVLLPLVARISLGTRVDLRDRTGRSTYVLLDLRLSREIGPLRLFLDGTNLFDQSYQEVFGVTMPGRWFGGGVDVLRW